MRRTNSARTVRRAAALVVIVMGAVSACGSGAEEQPSGSSTSESSAAAQEPGPTTSAGETSSVASSEEPAEPVTLTFVGYGGETQGYQAEATQVPFTERTGIQFQNDSPVNNAKLKAMVDSGDVSWDVVAVSSAAASQYCGTYLQPIDPAVVDKSVIDSPSQSSKCGVQAYFSQNVQAYNTDTYPTDPPTTIEDFFDTEKYPGKRMFPPILEPGIYEVALLADGVAPEDLYPLDIDRALKKLDTIKSVSVFAESYGEMQQAMMDGSVDMAMTAETRLSYVLRDGGHWEPVWDKTIINWDEWAIPMGSPHAAEANQFLDFVLEPEPQAKMAERTTHPPVNPAAKPQFDEFQEKASAFSTQGDRGTVIYTNSEWWGQHLDEAYERFTAWQIG